jgi:hypothetical protein
VGSDEAEALSREILPGVPDLAPGPGVHVIKDNNVRAVFSLDAVANLPSLIVKRYKLPDASSRLKRLFVGTKALQEWRGSQAVLARGIPTCRAYALGEPRGGEARSGSSYVVLEKLEDTVPVVSLLRELLPLVETELRRSSPDRLGTIEDETRARVARDPLARKKRSRLLTLLAGLTRKILESGLHHKDFHTGNVLARILPGGDLRVWLVDLHSVQTRPLPGHRVRMLAKLFLDLESFTTEWERRRFLRDCFDIEALPYKRDLERLHVRVTRKTASLRARRQRSRTRRCVVRSSRYWSEETEAGLMYHLRAVPPARVEEALSTHAALLAGAGASGEVLKRSGSERTLVTRVRMAGSSPDERLDLCVKEHHPRGLMDRLRSLLSSRGRDEWMASSAFRVLGLPTPEGVALVERPRGGASFFVARFAEGSLELDAWLETAFSRSGEASDRRRRLTVLETTAQLLARLHRLSVYHNDLKARNVLVHPEDPTRLLLIDLAGVRPWRRVDRKRRLKNLAQLDTSIPYSVSRTDRLRFLVLYRETLRGTGSSDDSRLPLHDHARSVLRAGEGRVNYRREGARGR